MDYSVLVAISLWVLKHINAISILPFLFSSLTVSFYSPIEDEKGLALRHSVYRYIDLECALLFVLATLGLLKLNS
jgi:hypothetical protein